MTRTAVLLLLDAQAATDTPGSPAQALAATALHTLRVNFKFKVQFGPASEVARAFNVPARLGISDSDSESRLHNLHSSFHPSPASLRGSPDRADNNVSACQCLHSLQLVVALPVERHSHWPVIYCCNVGSIAARSYDANPLHCRKARAAGVCGGTWKHWQPPTNTRAYPEADDALENTHFSELTPRQKMVLPRTYASARITSSYHASWPMYWASQLSPGYPCWAQKAQ